MSSLVKSNILSSSPSFCVHHCTFCVLSFISSLLLFSGEWSNREAKAQGRVLLWWVLFRKHWVMLMQLQPMAFILFTHVIKLYNVVIVDIHGVEVYFCSHQCSFPAVLPPSQWCDRHEGLGGCSQQSQQNHCECHTHTSYTCTHKWCHNWMSLFDVWIEKGSTSSSWQRICFHLSTGSCSSWRVDWNQFVLGWHARWHVDHKRPLKPLVNEETEYAWMAVIIHMSLWWRCQSTTVNV